MTAAPFQKTSTNTKELHDMNATMNAYVTTAGLGLHKKQLAVPTPGPEQLLVRTRAVALNNADLSRSGDEHLAGYEFSGEVVAVGEGVDETSIGRRVAGTAPGAFAEYVLVNHGHVITIPDTISFEEAAALPTALLTEHGALTLARVGVGDSVLFTAATSGIGLIGVQIARVLGASPVIATTRSSAKRALLDSVGADLVINTDEEDLVDAVLAATDGAGVAVVLDHVAGEMLARTVLAARVDGTVISVGRLSGSTATVDLFALAARHVTIRSVSFGFTPPEVISDLLNDLTAVVLPAVADGRIKAIIDQVFDFDDIDSAMDRLRDGQAHGKVVLTLG